MTQALSVQLTIAVSVRLTIALSVPVWDRIEKLKKAMNLIENKSKSFRVVLLTKQDLDDTYMDEIALELRGKAIDVLIAPYSARGSLQLDGFMRKLNSFMAGDTIIGTLIFS